MIYVSWHPLPSTTRQRRTDSLQASVVETLCFQHFLRLTHTHTLFYLFKGGLLSTQSTAAYSHTFTSGRCQVQLHSSSSSTVVNSSSAAAQSRASASSTSFHRSQTSADATAICDSPPSPPSTSAGKDCIRGKKPTN